MIREEVRIPSKETDERSRVRKLEEVRKYLRQVTNGILSDELFDRYWLNIKKDFTENTDKLNEVKFFHK